MDFSGLHIVLLYAQKGIDYWSEKGDDPYQVTWPDDTDPAINKRQATKLLLLTAINAADEKKAFKGFRNQCDKGSPERMLKNKVLAQVLSALKAKHKPIADKIASGAGIDLMYLDSAITERIISYFTDKGIPILTVHDSYVVPFGHDNVLMLQMQDAFFALTKVKNVKLTHTTINSEDYWWADSWGEEQVQHLPTDLGVASERHKNDVVLFKKARNLPKGHPEWVATWTAVY